MEKVKEILRLRSVGLSIRDIASSIGCGKTAVAQTLERAVEAGVTDAASYSNNDLEAMLFPRRDDGANTQDEPDMQYILIELAKKGVTRQLLWDEYKAEHPNGLMYTQFCERIRNALKAEEIEYHKPHKAGDECEVDWAGTTISYADMAAGAFKEASIFVAVLPASSFPFAYAYADRKKASWIDAHIRAFRFFNGTPRILAPDCTKTAVTTPDLFDPVLTKTYYEMAAHYGITIVPARPYHPRDKNIVENSVQNVTRRIIAALRNEHFTSVAQINESIYEKLIEFINRPFKKMPGCRKSAFEQIDKPALRPLPLRHYELAEFKEAKIGINYHVEYAGFLYSVPHMWHGQECTIRATKDTIEVYVDGERICAHVRNYNTSDRYKTAPEHLPEKHRVVSEWNDGRFISWAGKYGSNMVAYIKALLDSVEYSVQAYRACMGVMRQVKDVPADIVEAVSAQALEKRQFSSRYFQSLLRHKLREDTERRQAAKSVIHGNIRGKKAYEGGGFHAQ